MNRDTLFSYHKASETFLANLMSIYVAAHYKNTPNDLQMISDAPAHHLFVLMAPVSSEQSNVPRVIKYLKTFKYMSFRYWLLFKFVLKVRFQRKKLLQLWNRVNGLLAI